MFSDRTVQLLAPLILLSSPIATAMIDLNGDGVSDLWQQIYPSLLPNGDDDSDGYSNAIESYAGTDPLSRDSTPKISDLATNGNVVTLTWDSVAAKAYEIERYNATLDSWSSVTSLVSDADGPLSVEIPMNAASEIFRLKISDIDNDGDGLSAWEEKMLVGFSDNTLRSPSNGNLADYSAAVRKLEGTGTLTLSTGLVIPQRPVTKSEAARFLTQATFGPDPDLINEVAAIGLGAWIDQQLNPTTPTETKQTMTGQGGTFPLWWGMGWWKAAMTGEDQLRLKLGNALSQILVISITGNDLIRGNSNTQADYYDILLQHALGNYRDLLEDVTYSTQMGFYLSHLQNRKSDPSIDRFPDENFAREIMQLFTIGLWELELDGTQKLDSEGKPQPTYTNATITEMAKVFTGFGFGGPQATSFYAPVNGNDFVYPMKMWDDEHEPGVKNIVNGVTIPAGQTGVEDVSDALDALCNHPNIAPFISKLLIQRFTCSNPTPSYVRRVASSWNDNGAGQRGDLKSVIEAILMDPEARTPSANGDASGKVREPFLRAVAIARAFKARNERSTPTFPVWPGVFLQDFGQRPLSANSVFNFYLPDHQPSGELRDRGLFSPELEIATHDRLIKTDNRIYSHITTGILPYGSDPIDYLKCDFSVPLSIAVDSASVPQLVDYLDDLLTWGMMSSTTRAAVIQATQAQTTPLARVQTAVHLIAESPDYIVLK
ncbi:DUF1800 family protein [Oceaniferula spumae]